MLNKIVILKGSKKTCRILDSIIENNNTLYMTIDFESGSLLFIKPRDIFEIVDYDVDREKLHSMTNVLISHGL